MRRAILLLQLASKFLFTLVVLAKTSKVVTLTRINCSPVGGTVAVLRKQLEMERPVEALLIYELGEWHYPTGLLLQVAVAVVVGPMREVALAVGLQV
jgi:hypothetical protein